MRWAGDRPQRLSDFGGHLSYRNSLQRKLRDQEAQPFSEFVSLLQAADRAAESEQRMQSDRGDIHPADADHHRVTAFRLASLNQLSQEHLAIQSETCFFR
jgi:hypothetical protein